MSLGGDFGKGVLAGVAGAAVAALAVSLVTKKPAKTHTKLETATALQTAVSASCAETYVPEEIINNSEKLKEGFMKVFDELTAFLLKELEEKFDVLPRHRQYIDRMIRYNCIGGKYNRALFVQTTLIQYKKGTGGKVTENELLKARVLGWCIEWLQACFLVADDIMDYSLTRRGQDCWYKVKDVGLIACNDFLILESHIYRILKQYFGTDLETYVRVSDLFHEVAYQTELGQLNDLRLQSDDKQKNVINLDLFTMHNYSLIVKYKTAFYSFYLPLACGLIVANVKDEQVFNETKDICLLMGEYFQIQDDYLDCYADPKVLGKVGRDIEEAKCSWLVVQALKKTTEVQKQIIQDNYGIDDQEKVKTIKALYKELNLEKTFFEYEELAAKELNEMIEKSKLNKTNQHGIYTTALAAIFKRQK